MRRLLYYEDRTRCRTQCAQGHGSQREVTNDTFPFCTANQQARSQFIDFLCQFAEQGSGDHMSACHDAKALLKRCCEIVKFLPGSIQHSLFYIGRCCPYQLL